MHPWVRVSSRVHRCQQVTVSVCTCETVHVCQCVGSVTSVCYVRV